MRFTSAAVSGAMVVSLFGCDVQSPTEIAPTSLAPGLQAAAFDREGAGPMVTGNAIFEFPDVERKAPLSFTARVLPNGTVQGEMINFDQTRGGYRVHGSTTCMKVDDAGSARLRAVVDISGDPDIPVGTHLYWRVWDRGSTEPDGTSYLIVAKPSYNPHYIAAVDRLCDASTANYVNAVTFFLGLHTVPNDPSVRARWAAALEFHQIDFGNLTIHP